MARREFTKKVQRAALTRAGYRCEAVTPAGRCPNQAGRGAPVEFHHVVADTLGGEPTLANCAALCPRCHKVETARLARIVAQAQRRADAHDGIRDPHRRKIPVRVTPKAAPQRSARAPVKADALPRLSPRALFVPAQS